MSKEIGKVLPWNQYTTAYYYRNGVKLTSMLTVVKHVGFFLFI